MGLGRNIRARRKELGLTQSKMGVEIISTSYVSLIETEKQIPSMEIVKLLAERLKTTVDYLMDYEVKEEEELLGEWMGRIQRALCELRVEEVKEQFLHLESMETVNLNSTAIKMLELFSMQAELEDGNINQGKELLIQFEEKWLPVDHLPKVYAFYLYIKADYLHYEARYEHALSCLRQVEEIKESLPVLYMEHFLLLSAQCLAEQGDFLSSYKHLHEVQQRLVQQGRWIELCKAKIIKSTIDQLFHYTNDAYTELNSTEQLLKINQNSRLLYLVYYNLGRIAQKRGHLEEAIDSFSKCIQVNAVHFGRAFADLYIALAEVFCEQDRLMKALEFADKAVKCAYNSSLLCNVYLLIAEIKRKENNANEQLKALLVARKYAMESKNAKLMCQCNQLIGHFFYEKAEYRKSSLYFVKASTSTE